MATRTIKAFPKAGSVSRRKLRAAVKQYAQSTPYKYKKGRVRQLVTASGRKQIAFRKVAA